MNSYLSQQFLDEDYKSFCPRENGSHLFFKEVGKHTVYKVVHPEHIEIYSIVRPRNKEKGKEEDFFEIIKLIPDYMDMRFFMPNNMDQFYFKSEMKTKGIVSCEKFRKAQITDIKRYQNGSFQTVWYLASFFNSNISVVKGDTVFLRGYRISDKSYNGFDYLDLTCSDIIGIHNL